MLKKHPNPFKIIQQIKVKVFYLNNLSTKIEICYLHAMVSIFGSHLFLKTKNELKI